MDDCLFCKFAKKELPKEFVYEDGEVMVFEDIHPVRPIHLLVVPKKHVEDFLELEDANLNIKIMETVKKMIKEKGLDKKGYRMGINGGGAQVIRHLHVHLFGPMSKSDHL